MEKDSSDTHQIGPSRARKQMRKGTHSCTECRRRKIRCTFARNALVCSPCSVRGSRCVDQQQEPFVAQPSHDTAGQGSVKLTESLAGSTSSDPIGHASDTDILVDEESNRVPLVSLIVDHERWSTAGAPASLSPGSGNLQSDSHQQSENSESANISQLSQRKAEDVCRILRSALPNYDSLMATLAERGSWWKSYRFKTHMNSGQTAESLIAFAARNYTSKTPALLGIVAASYARCLNRNHQIYSLVESLVISDFEYVSNIDGLHCLMLVAKSLTDIGHPRRAWLVWRRGMSIAQIMGIYRTKPNQVLANNVWWAIFHGDRFTSMLLGVPHGFNDVYYSSKPRNEPDQDQFILDSVLIAGKIIERNMMSDTPSLAQALSLDEQLDAAVAALPSEWWELPNDVSRLSLDVRITEKLLHQFYFFHIRTYVHLPFMTKSSTKPTHIISKLACTEASRQLLKRFLMLRTEVQESCLFECKTTSFVAFMAAVILIIGLDLGHMPMLSASADDMDLLRAVRDIFRQTMDKEGCKISAQCCNTLDILMGTHEGATSAAGVNGEGDKIIIPYFGIVVRRRMPQGTQLGPEHSFRGSAQFDQGQLFSTSQTATANSHTTELQPEIECHSFEYSGLLDLGDAGLAENGPGGSDLTNPAWASAWLMDLDQDWGMFTTFNEP